MKTGVIIQMQGKGSFGSAGGATIKLDSGGHSYQPFGRMQHGGKPEIGATVEILENGRSWRVISVPMEEHPPEATYTEEFHIGVASKPYGVLEAVCDLRNDQRNANEILAHILAEQRRANELLESAVKSLLQIALK